MARKNKVQGIDPEYLLKQKASLRRKHRVSVLLNDKELEAVREYCRRFKVSSRSALIRRATMEQVLSSLDDSHPTLF